eukprot:jgi/Bigna1/77423/fgenesh1_pg.48_\
MILYLLPLLLIIMECVFVQHVLSTSCRASGRVNDKLEEGEKLFKKVIAAAVVLYPNRYWRASLNFDDYVRDECGDSAEIALAVSVVVDVFEIDVFPTVRVREGTFAGLTVTRTEAMAKRCYSVDSIATSDKLKRLLPQEGGGWIKFPPVTLRCCSHVQEKFLVPPGALAKSIESLASRIKASIDGVKDVIFRDVTEKIPLLELLDETYALLRSA